MQDTCDGETELAAIHKRLAAIAAEIASLVRERERLDKRQRQLAIALWEQANGFKLRSIASFTDEDAIKLIASIINL